MRTYHQDGTAPDDAEAIFVFGSNLAGVHGAGAARAALDHYGAVSGRGVGLAGRSYAIPTKDRSIKTMPLTDIARHVEEFIHYSRDHPGKLFFVTRIGCGLAGYRDEEIAPVFTEAAENCSFAEQWKPFLEPKGQSNDR